MILAWRAWAIRRVTVGWERRYTGRTIDQVLPRDLIADLAIEHWTQHADELPPLADAYRVVRVPEVEAVPILQETLVGTAGPDEVAWDPGLNTARCLTHPTRHTPPVDHAELHNPGCGFYGLNRRDLVEPHDLRPTAVLGHPLGGCFCVIVGLAGLSGEVTEARRGYRASHARVLALLADPSWRDARHHRDVFGGVCGCAWCGSVRTHGVTGDPDERARSHLEGLAARYEVPIFTDPGELEAYAAELHEPVTWPTTDVPSTTETLRAAAYRMAAALPARLPTTDDDDDDPDDAPSGFAYQPGGWVPGPLTTPIPPSAFRTLPPGPRPPRGASLRPPPWWGAGRPPPGTGPAPTSRWAGGPVIDP